MEDALSSHISPSGILVKNLLWKDSQPQKRLEKSTPNSSQQWQQKNEELSVVTYNCRGLTASLHDIEQLCVMYRIIFLQETWLAKQTLDKLTDISDNHACGIAEVNYPKGITSGRPYGGTAILQNKKLNDIHVDFQHLEKVLNLAILYIKYWKSMGILNSTICSYKFCSFLLMTVLQMFLLCVPRVKYLKNGAKWWY